MTHDPRLATSLKKVLVLDNFDSFTYNLVDCFRQLGCRVVVYRNTADPEQLAREDFDLLVLSPGPSVPQNAGNMMQVIARFYRQKPILGVCLGHQALIEFFGGSLENIAPVHGKSEPVEHDGRGIFTGLEQGCSVARYHSWAGNQIPSELEVSARSRDGAVMAVRHKRLPIEGIQFHPESVLSMKNDAGMRMLRNVVAGRLAAGNRTYQELAGLLQTGAAIKTDILRAFLKGIEEDQFSDDQKQILLVSLSHHLQKAPELARFIAVLMEFAAPFPVADKRVVDICGTGGSGLPRVNTSTLAALLLAYCGLPVAKHGNRAAAGRYGSFNLLENLGISPRYLPEQTVRAFESTGLAFLFAPDIHPVFRHLAPARARMGVPTVFNVLGPLVNPALPERQFIGTAFADLMETIFETAINMGKRHVIVVRGDDGLDEISVSTTTLVLEFCNGRRREYTLRPEDFGIEPLPFDAVSAASPEACLKIAEAMLEGKAETAHHHLIAVNAAFIYTRFVEDLPLPAAHEKMERLIGQGVMGEILHRYREILESLPQSVRA